MTARAVPQAPMTENLSLGASFGRPFPTTAASDEPEELVFVHDRGSGLRAAISIQSTVLGPALGGCRFHPYASVDDAITDVVRLGTAMTAKASVAGLDLGGGKAVIIGDAHSADRAKWLRAFGRLVNDLGGRYITAEDVGTTTADMDLIGEETAYVVGRSSARGGAGDPSDATALGVFEAMRATVGHVSGSMELSGVSVVVPGVGKVGSRLVERLVTAGALVTVSDVVSSAAERMHALFGVEVVAPADAYRVPCTVLAPCALGGVVSKATIGHLRCRMIVGSANNMLAEREDADRLADAGIVYAPDFVVNAGGLIHVAEELNGFDKGRMEARVRAIGATTKTILTEASTEAITPLAAAERRARRRIAEHLAATT